MNFVHKVTYNVMHMDACKDFPLFVTAIESLSGYTTKLTLHVDRKLHIAHQIILK